MQQIPAAGTPDRFRERAVEGEGGLGKRAGRDRGRHIQAHQRTRRCGSMNIEIAIAWARPGFTGYVAGLYRLLFTILVNHSQPRRGRRLSLARMMPVGLRIV